MAARQTGERAPRPKAGTEHGVVARRRRRRRLWGARSMERERTETRPSRSPTALGIVCMGLDDFEAINDRHGHEVGDEVLVKVSARLRSSVRGTDRFTQVGADEFVVVCDAVTDPRDLIEVGNRLRTAVSLPFEVPGSTLLLTMSMGLAYATDTRVAVDDLLREANAAMWR